MTTPPTIQFASFAYGELGPALDDPAEALHEAAKLHPSISPRMPELSPPLLASMRRSSRRHPHRRRVALPDPRMPRARLGKAIAARRSRPPAVGAGLKLAELASLVRAYAWDERRAHRAVPSGGGLYPLELYVLARRVDGLAAGVYHLDPCEPSLELLREDLPDLRRALVEPTLADVPALLVITAVFWRSRCKYGLRGYRFALLEAGHLVQTILLLVSARGLAALPLGGVYEPELERLLGVDGVDESVVYAVAVGRPR